MRLRCEWNCFHIASNGSAASESGVSEPLTELENPQLS
jgi:hypothetical protein